jgi:hypothetical protein
LNVGVLVAFGVAVVLAYAFFMRVTTATPDPHRLDNPGNLLGDIIQVQVLNATTENGLAQQMMEYLRGEGFDVVETGNYTSGILEKSVIQDRVGNLDAAEQVALAVGLPPTRITQDIKPEYFLDATIIIGMDFETLKPWNEDMGEVADSTFAESDSDN